MSVRPPWLDRHGTDRQYAQGWDSGFRQCRSEMAATIETDRLESGYNDDDHNGMR